MSEGDLYFVKVGWLIREIRSAEMMVGNIQFEIGREMVKICLTEKVIFEGGKGTTCVEIPCDSNERAPRAENLVQRLQGRPPGYLRKCKEVNVVGAN